MTEASPPLVPADVDLRNFPFMPLDVVRLRDSDLVTEPDGDIFRANVLSWCIAWHQVPAASLPDDDATLARLLGYGRDLRGWRKARAGGGLRGWVKCADGRLYHPVVAEKALAAWNKKQAQRQKTEAARKALADRRQEHLSQPLSQSDAATVEHLVIASKGDGMEKKGESPSSLRSEGGAPPALALASEDQQQRAGKNKRGSRLTLTELPERWALYARGRGHPDPGSEFVVFRNYWIARAGEKGVKLDWEAVWQNWIIRTMQDGRPSTGLTQAATDPNAPPELTPAFAPYLARLRQHLGDPALRSWFTKCDLRDERSGLVLIVPSSFHANFINQNFTTQLRLVFEPRSCEVRKRERANPGQPVAIHAAE